MSKPSYENVVFIDEARREHWLHILDKARKTGSVAVFNALQETDAVIIPFPVQTEPDGIA